MRITLDTNVLISTLIFKSKKLNTVMYNVLLDHRLVLSTYIIEELKLVIERKFPDKVDVIENFLSELPFELTYTPDNLEPSAFYIRDVKDYPVLYSAIVENVDILITGDKDFQGIDIDKPEIMIPTEFLEKYYSE